VKPAVIFISGALGAILVISEVVALVKMTDMPDIILATPIPQPLPVNIVRPSALHLNRLPTGIYETVPCSILLKRTGDAGDNCVLGNPEPIPRMPVRHPKLRLIPASQVKK
jgi:hypothetical protein